MSPDMRAGTVIDQRSSITAPVEGTPSSPVTSTHARGGDGLLARVRMVVRASTVEQKYIALLLLLFLAKGVVITFAHAPYSGHDEVAHYAYLQVVADERRVPVMPELTTWREQYEQLDIYSHDRMPGEFWEYCRRTTIDWSPGCGEYSSPIYAMSLAGEYFPTGWIYTSNHPPLYYLLMTPLYWVSQDASIEAQLYLLRLAAIPFGLLTVLFAWLSVRTLFPGDRFLALTVPTVVAFQPQVSYEAAMLNNDILAIAFTSIAIYLLVRGLRDRFPIRIVVLIGFFYGLAALSKNTALTTGAIIAFAMILGLGVRNWREWIPRGAIAAGVAGLMLWPWYLYMYRTYGDLTGLNRIRDLQYWNYGGQADTPTIWDQLSSRAFFWMRWRETWGEFGWRLIPLSTDLLRILLWVCMVGALGVAVWAVRLHRVNHHLSSIDDPAEAARFAREADPVFMLARWQVVGVLTMGATCVLAYYAILQFGTTFSLTQARYYFPAIVPAAILLMLGYRSILPRRWLPYSQAVVFLALVVLTVVIYSSYVLPYWASAGKALFELEPLYRD